jgi:hypothetical protein
LEHGEADIADVNDREETVWDMLADHIESVDATQVIALLRVMVLKGAPPDDLVAQLRPEHARVVEERARLRAALPAYLARRQALLDAHCLLIAPLRDLVRDYDSEPTTTDELWATGLGADPDVPEPALALAPSQPQAPGVFRVLPRQQSFCEQLFLLFGCCSKQ